MERRGSSYLTPPASPSSTPRFQTTAPSPGGRPSPRAEGYSAGRKLPKELSVNASLSPLSQFTSLLSPLLSNILPTPPATPLVDGLISPKPNGFASAIERDRLSAPPSPAQLSKRPYKSSQGGKRTRTRTRTRARRLLLLCIILLAFGSVINNLLSSLTRLLTRQRRRYKAIKAATGVGSKDYVRTGRHPIRHRLEQAHALYTSVRHQQSRDAEMAAAEYTKRYAREPPEGFPEWFDYAKGKGVALPDEYDALMDSLEPFWALPPSEFRRRTRELAVLPSFSMVRVSSVDAMAVASPEWDASALAGRALAEILSGLVGKVGIGEMAFAVNEMATPRVIIPWEESERLADVLRNGPNATLPQRAAKPDWPNPLWEGDGSTWQYYVRTCPPKSPARRAITTLSTGLQTFHHLESGRDEWLLSHNGRNPSSRRRRGRRRDLPSSSPSAASSLFEALDSPSFSFPIGPGFSDVQATLCQSPALHDQHGLFFSDYRILDELYPVISLAKVDGFADILVPPLAIRDAPNTTQRSHQARQDTFGRWTTKLEHEVPWAARDSRLFWRGEPTGESESPPGYELNFARPRLLRKTSIAESLTAGETADVVAHTSKGRQLAVVRSNLGSLNARTTDVALVGLRGCGSARACAALEGGEGYAFANPETVKKGLAKAKAVIDVDGDGESLTRFIDIVDAGAVALRGSIFRDAFSDQAIPWMHYIPLSPDFRELYHLHAYFLGSAVDTSTSLTSWSLTSRSSPVNLQTAKLKHSIRHEGHAALRRIAEEGQKWRRENARRVDVEVYVYRLALEWSRLWSRTDEEYWASAVE